MPKVILIISVFIKAEYALISISFISLINFLISKGLENFSLFFDVNWPNKKEHITIFSSDIYPRSNIFSVQCK